MKQVLAFPGRILPYFTGFFWPTDNLIIPVKCRKNLPWKRLTRFRWITYASSEACILLWSSTTYPIWVKDCFVSLLASFFGQPNHPPANMDIATTIWAVHARTRSWNSKLKWICKKATTTSDNIQVKLRKCNQKHPKGGSMSLRKMCTPSMGSRNGECQIPAVGANRQRFHYPKRCMW